MEMQCIFCDVRTEFLMSLRWIPCFRGVYRHVLIQHIVLFSVIKVHFLQHLFILHNFPFFFLQSLFENLPQKTENPEFILISWNLLSNLPLMFLFIWHSILMAPHPHLNPKFPTIPQFSACHRNLTRDLMSLCWH